MTLLQKKRFFATKCLKCGKRYTCDYFECHNLYFESEAIRQALAETDSEEEESKENPNLVLSGGLSKLSDILKSKDKTFQHLKNIEAFALKELQYAKEKREWMLKTYGAVITDLPSNEHVKKIWKEAQKGMIALDPTRYEGGEEK